MTSEDAIPNAISPIEPEEEIRPCAWAASATRRAEEVLADYEQTLEIVEGSNNGS